MKKYSLYIAQVCNVYVYFGQLTVDQGVESAVSPIPRRVDDFWGFCILATTARLSEDHSSSPTFPPIGSAAQGCLPLHTIHK